MNVCNSMLRHGDTSPPHSNFFHAANQYILFHQKTALCCVLIFFHVKRKQPCLVKSKKRCVFEIPFQNPFEAGNHLNAGVLSESASSNHALLITKSAFMIKKKCPLSQPISIYMLFTVFARMICMLSTYISTFTWFFTWNLRNMSLFYYKLITYSVNCPVHFSRIYI